MAWSTADIPDLSGRVAVVTGANSGIGYHTSLELARKGAHVVLACRSAERGEAAITRLRAELPDASVELRELDLSRLASVRAFAEGLRLDRLDLLINNAGVMAIPRRLTEDGFETQLAVNHLAHFALTGLLLDKLIASAPSRVVTVSSQMHALGEIRFSDLDRERYDKWQAYSQSKLANALFGFELARRLPEGVKSVVAHPGLAATNLQSVGPREHGSGLGERFWAGVNATFAQSAADGALPSLYAATAEDVQSGDYIGPRAPFGWRGRPRRAKASAKAYDAEVARRLWEISVARTGVAFTPPSESGAPSPG